MTWVWPFLTFPFEFPETRKQVLPSYWYGHARCTRLQDYTQMGDTEPIATRPGTTGGGDSLWWLSSNFLSWTRRQVFQVIHNSFITVASLSNRFSVGFGRLSVSSRRLSAFCVTVTFTGVVRRSQRRSLPAPLLRLLPLLYFVFRFNSWEPASVIDIE